MNGRMLRENKYTCSDHGGNPGKYDPCLRRFNGIYSRSGLLDESICSENAEVIAQTENKRGHDDIDKVERNVENSSDSQNPDPAQNHREESK
ncbi:hypothetical protein D3C86_1298670 [compost metagenome]